MYVVKIGFDSNTKKVYNTTMNKCIICQKNQCNSVEHIFPDSLGGKITINICKDCNDKLGRKVDSKILNDEFILVIRSLLEIPNKKNETIDLLECFSNDLKTVDSNEKVIIKKQKLYDNKKQSFIINPTEDLKNIRFNGNKVEYSNITDIDTLVNLCEKEAKHLNQPFDKSDFREKVLNNGFNKLDYIACHKEIHFHCGNYIFEFLKIIYESMYFLYEEKFLKTKFGICLRNIIYNFIENDIANMDRLRNYKYKMCVDTDTNNVLNCLLFVTKKTNMVLEKNS